MAVDGLARRTVDTATTPWKNRDMPDRRVGDWRNGVDLDEEMDAWRETTHRAQWVFGVGFVISTVFLVVFAFEGSDGGVLHMGSALFFMAAFLGALMLLRRRMT